MIRLLLIRTVFFGYGIRLLKTDRMRLLILLIDEFLLVQMQCTNERSLQMQCIDKHMYKKMRKQLFLSTENKVQKFIDKIAILGYYEYCKLKLNSELPKRL